MILFTSWLAAMMLGLVLIMLNFFLKQNFAIPLMKISFYECGFSPKFSARLPFSLRFFLLAILFLVFDIELVILIASPLISFTNFLLPTYFFLLFLFFGFIHEWNEGSVNWVK